MSSGCSGEPQALRQALRTLAGSVYRAKGVVYAANAPGQRAVLQVVGRRVGISLSDDWGQRIPRTQIVAIGAADGLDTSALDDAFASCLAWSR